MILYLRYPSSKSLDLTIKQKKTQMEFVHPECLERFAAFIDIQRSQWQLTFIEKGTFTRRPHQQ